MTEKRLKGWNLIDDKNWKERMEQIKNRHPSPQSDQGSAPSESTLRAPIAECDPNCVICRGNAFYIDSQDFAVECPNARRKLSGGD